MASRILTVIGYAATRGWRWLVGDRWQRALARLAVVLAVFGIAALAFVSAGFAPISASAGHWPVTRFLLHYAMIRGVETRALAVKPPKDPALDERAMVLKGAGHYATSCMPCHGAPGHPRAAVVHHMSPAPPYLPPKISHWSDSQLFWIVRHGVKFTAMPAWPADQRDDEVWAMVAFLRRLPELTPAQFEQLAYGDRAELAPVGARLADLGGVGAAAGAGTAGALALRVADCARCHGDDGRGRGTGAFPALAGQHEEYLLASLRAFARGERHSGVMGPVANALGAGEMRALAEYYAAGSTDLIAAEAAPTGGSDRAGDAARGEQLARRGDPARRVPSCVECHGPGTGERNPMYPKLAGQHPDYLVLQLKLFKEGRRGGTHYSQIMETVAASLEPEDMRDLAAWYGSLQTTEAVTPANP